MNSLFSNSKHPNSIVEHLFCALGNGYELNHKLKLRQNYDDDEAFVFPEPTPFTWMYPWNDNPQFQPFRELVGCKDVGFAETVDYFLKCLEITPKEVAKNWADKADLIREVLSQTIDLPEYDKDDAAGFIQSLQNPNAITNNHGGCDPDEEQPNSVKKVWFLDAQWSDLPEEIELEVKQLWRDYELGNDYFMVKKTLDDELFEAYPKIYLWCKYKGVVEGEEVIIHWWW